MIFLNIQIIIIFVSRQVLDFLDHVWGRRFSYN